MRKKILTVLTIFVIVNFVNAKENFATNVKEKYELITYDFHDIEFQLPKEIELRENKTSENSVTYNVWFTDLEKYLNQPGYMLNEPINEMKEEDSNITMDKIRKILKEKGSIGSLNAYNLNYHEESWKLVIKENLFGDSIFGAGDVPLFSSFLITVYADNGFYFINLSTKLFNDIEKRYPEIFNLQNGSLYWNEKKDNKRTCVKFWELISARDSNLPEELILLKDAYDIFLETVRFN